MSRELKIDDKFICKLKKGDVKSFQQLYEHFAPSMKMICFRYLKSDADAEDVFQDAFVKIYSSVKQLKNQKLFVGWMKRIFINTSIDFLKQKQKF